MILLIPETNFASKKAIDPPPTPPAAPEPGISEIFL